MPDSYVALRVHCIFSTKNREKIIPVNLQSRLSSFMAGIARQNGITPIAVNGSNDDDAHALIALPPTMSIAKAMQLVKAGSSRIKVSTRPGPTGKLDGAGEGPTPRILPRPRPVEPTRPDSP